MAQLQTERFLLRPLTESDATQRYLSWFDGDGAANIVSAADVQGLDDLRHYIADKSGRSDVLFLGIFDQDTGLHIGNLKYEPVDSTNGYAMLGIFIGDKDSRSKGVARETISASGLWLKQNRGIHQIVLGVLKDNIPAVRAYEKIGFEAKATPHFPHTTEAIVSMIWNV